MGIVLPEPPFGEFFLVHLLPAPLSTQQTIIEVAGSRCAMIVSISHDSSNVFQLKILLDI